MATQQFSGRTSVRSFTDLSFLTSDPSLTSELIFNRGLVSKSGEINGMLFSIHTRGVVLGTPHSSGGSEFWALVAKPKNNAMEPYIPEGCLFSVETESAVVSDGDAVLARVVNHAKPYNFRERLLETTAEHIDWFWKFFPDRVDTSTIVLRTIEHDSDTGRVCLKALAPGYPAILEDESTSIEILGRARPDFGRDERFQRNRDKHERLLGYKGRPEPWMSAEDLARNPVHEGLSLVLREETAFPGCMSDFLNELTEPLRKSAPLRDFREDESYVHNRHYTRFPVDRLCARMFRSGQLSQRLEFDALPSASFTLLDAEELTGSDGIVELVSCLGPSPLYRDVTRQYREAAQSFDHGNPSQPMPIARLCARMFRAGQLRRLT